MQKQEFLTWLLLLQHVSNAKKCYCNTEATTGTKTGHLRNLNEKTMWTADSQRVAVWTNSLYTSNEAPNMSVNIIASCWCQPSLELPSSSGKGQVVSTSSTFSGSLLRVFLGREFEVRLRCLRAGRNPPNTAVQWQLDEQK